MLLTSYDMFWWVMSFVTLLLGVILAWVFLTIALILWDTRKVTANIRHKLDALDQILSLLKGKLETTAVYLPLLVEGATKLMGMARERSAKKKAKETASPKKKS